MRRGGVVSATTTSVCSVIFLLHGEKRFSHQADVKAGSRRAACLYESCLNSSKRHMLPFVRRCYLSESGVNALDTLHRLSCRSLMALIKLQIAADCIN